MNQNFIKSRKVLFVVLLFTSTITSLVFQNCAKSVDLSQYSGASSATAPCAPPASLLWTVGTATCMAPSSIITLTSGSTITVNATLPSLGSAIYSCNAGVLTETAGSTCDLSCAEPATLTWKVGAYTCSAPGGASVLNGATATVSDISTNKGTATFTCASNALNPTPTNATCAPNAAPAPVPPPTITTQPLGTPTTTVFCAGDGWVLSVVASAVNVATYPLSYQWYKNGLAVAGATLSSYTDPITAGTSPVYVVVSNAGGSVQSVTVNDVGRGPLTAACGGGRTN